MDGMGSWMRGMAEVLRFKLALHLHHPIQQYRAIDFLPVCYTRRSNILRSYVARYIAIRMACVGVTMLRMCEANQVETSHRIT